MRLCTICNTEKSEEEFSVKRKVTGRCRICHLKQCAEYRKNNKDILHEKQKKYKDTKKKNRHKYYKQDKEYRLKHKDNIKKRKDKWYQDNKVYVREYGKGYCQENKEKGYAKYRVARAIKKGTLKRGSCLLCLFQNGKINNTNIDGHHHRGYKNVLDVLWLCRSHHRETHVIQDRPNNNKIYNNNKTGTICKQNQQ